MHGLSPTNIFAPISTPAQSIFNLSLFVLMVTAAVFVIVFSLLAYVVIKFRERPSADAREPAQVYGSSQVELAWTVIPILIVLVLFLATTRVIADIQGAARPRNAVEVTVVGHQFWWEYRYPSLHVVTANELHIPVSDPAHPTPTFLTLLSADTDHSFWVPRLAGKTDLIPDHPNSMWVDPHETGLYLGQCAQYCGTQHAKMLLRVYVQTRADFDRWIQEQSQPAQVSEAVPEAGTGPAQPPKRSRNSRVPAAPGSVVPASSLKGRKIFERTACVSCHTVRGTSASGTFGPDLTHLMSRDTIASGAVPNTPANLRQWVRDPNTFKPGSKMPAMGLSDEELDAVAAYLETLR